MARPLYLISQVNLSVERKIEVKPHLLKFFSFIQFRISGKLIMLYE